MVTGVFTTPFTVDSTTSVYVTQRETSAVPRKLKIPLPELLQESITLFPCFNVMVAVMLSVTLSPVIRAVHVASVPSNTMSVGQDGMHGAVMELLGGAIVLAVLPLPAGGEGEKQKRGKKQKCAGAEQEMAVKQPMGCRISHRKVHFNRSSILVLCSPENDNF